MIDLSYIVDGLQQDVNDIIDWSDDLYASNFGMYFQDQKKYYDLLTSNKRPATDQELEDMLTTIPLQLFSASEARSKFKITETIIIPTQIVVIMPITIRRVTIFVILHPV